VEQLIRYIELQIKELQQRLQGMERFRSVYVGAISYRGRHGLTSTDPHYAALDFLGVPHVASRMDTARVSAITGAYIDWEQLLEWNPELIFVDANGWSLVQQELQSRPEIFRILTAYRTKQLYLLWPYNNYHSNFEVMLANAWYLGKVLSPDRFADVVLREKVNEIMMHFVGDTIVGALEKCWGNYRNLLEE
jgi:iron complex transport system substrate-binding protein